MIMSPEMLRIGPPMLWVVPTLGLPKASVGFIQTQFRSL